MQAYLKSQSLEVTRNLMLRDFLINIACDPRTSKNGIIFVDNDGSEIVESYADLYQISLKILHALRQKGLKKGDYLIFQLRTEQYFIRVFWGCILGGIVPIPLPVPLTLSTGTEAFQKLLKINQQLFNPFIVTEENLMQFFEEEYRDNQLRYMICEELMSDLNHSTVELDALDNEDLAYIQYSSGSTGEPKGVLLSQNNVVYNIHQISDRLHFHLNKEHFGANWVPLTHDMGLVGFHLTPLSKGFNHIILSPDTFTKNPTMFLQKVQKYHVTHFVSPNFGLAWMNDKVNDDDIKNLDLSSVKLIHNGAEPISMEVVRRFYQKFRPAGLKSNVVYQVYGMAEACLAVSMPKIGEDNQSIIIDRTNNRIGNDIKELPIDASNAMEFAAVGKPIKDLEIKIVDDSDNLLLEEQIGNIMIKGPNVFKGYLRQDGARFTKDGFFSTGDLGFVKNGYLYVTGRKKDIIIVHGQNFFANDLERILGSTLPIDFNQTLVVSYFDNAKAKDEVIIFVRYTNNLKDFEKMYHKVQETLFQSLGFTADFVVFLTSFPKTASDKPQRYKLLEQFRNHQFENVMNGSTMHFSPTTAAPRNELESKIAHIWQSVLGIEMIGIEDNFFEIGGNSLKAAMLIAKIQKEMDMDLTLRQFFQKPTIKELVASLQNTAKTVHQKIPSIGKKEFYMVSSAQRRMFILNQFEKHSTQYNNAEILEVKGNLDRNHLQRSVDQLIQRHEAFRTSFEITAEGVMQKVQDEVENAILSYDISDKNNQQEAVNEIIKGFIKPFDLHQAPLIRVGLIQLAKERHILMFDTHHIISDGMSKEILIKDFTAIYNGEILQELKLQYKDFAVWQSQLYKSEEFKQQETYWLTLFTGEIPNLNLPSDYVRPVIQSFEGDRLFIKFDQKIKDGLDKIKTQTETTLYMVLLAALNILLSKYSGHEEIVIGSPVAGRSHTDLANIVGVFVNLLAMRNCPERRKTFKAFLTEVKENVVKALENQDYPFEELVEKILVKRDVSRNPLFDVLFALQNMDKSAIGIADLTITPYAIENPVSKFDLSIYAYELEDCIKLEFEYCTKLFTKKSIERFANSYQKVIEQVIENLEQAIEEIQIINETEKTKILVEFNGVNREYPVEKTIAELFEEQVQKSPDKVALIFEEQSLTYKALQMQSHQLAKVLRNRGVGPDSIVGVMVDRSFEMMIGILGVLKAGGAYLPIDPSYPSDRIDYMLEHSQTKIVLTEAKYRRNVRQDIETIDLKETDIYVDDGQILPKINSYKNLAYVIYTSGSTGKPKGVMIEQQALHNFINGVGERITFAQGSRILAITTISFDIFALETILPLCMGLEVVIAGEKDQVSPKSLLKLIRDQKIAMLQVTPSRMKMLLGESREDDFINIHTLMVGGEALPDQLFEELKKKGKWKIYNMYGPTETTVWSTICDLTDQSKVTIGKPIANTQIYILDSANNICPIGVTGELWIGGDGLARGYYRRPDLTAEKFINNPYQANKRIYRTGDLARWLPDGNIECLGRIDHQVKVRGYRIELGEIENQLLKIKGIKEAAVITKENQEGEKYLCGYFVSDQEKTVRELKEALHKSLPEYMVPAYFVKLDKLPLTPNGKIDRKMLPHPKENLESGSTFEAARNEFETKLITIWQEVLGKAKVSINDNFFEIGGNSIKIVQLSNRLSEALNREVEVITLFQYPTVSSFAQYITGASESDIQTAGAQQKPSDLHSYETNKNTEVAVIGMSGRFPKAQNIEEYWQLLKKSKEGISRFSVDELINSGVSSETLENPKYVRVASLLERIEYFDADFFGYSPSDAEIMDPQIRIFLECAWEALEDAGYNPEKYEGTVGVYAGASANFYWQYLTFSRTMNGASSIFNTMQLNDKQFLPTQVSYKLNLRGPSVYVNTACSSSLVAIHLACNALVNQECQIAIVGGINATQSEKEGYLYEAGMILSSDGYCRAFDAEANGTIFGNGIGVVVLKPLEKAIADGDQIYAVIKGSAINNDGKDKVGYTAPSVKGQRAVIEKALEVSKVSPESISYVETHGTGTALGDPVEIEALRQAYSSGQKGYCAIGSVKTNIGHLDAAAGIAGFIKTVLALKHREIPASLHFQIPNPKISFERTPFYVNTELKQWPAKAGEPRRAGVSSFGIGGTNAHVILEEAPVIHREKKEREWNILCISARTQNALKVFEENLVGHLQKNLKANLGDIAYTLGVGRKAFRYRKGVICRNANETIQILAKGDRGKARLGLVKEENKPVAFMFPGQGAQYVAMALGLYQQETRFREEMDRCFVIFDREMGYNLKEVLYGEAGDPKKINDTEIAQPLLYIIEYALAQLLISWGVEPEWMVGHSIGEYVAATLAGVLNLEEGIKLVAVRGKLMQKMAKGSMLSVMLNEQEAQKVARGRVAVAAINSTQMCVLSGKEEEIMAIEQKLNSQEVACVRLYTSHAYHSQMMEQAAEEFREYLQQCRFHAPKKKYLSNLTGDWINENEATNPEYWVKHMLKTVKFCKGIEKLLRIPNLAFIEVGPGKTLSTFVKGHEAYNAAHLVVNFIRHIKDKKSDEEYTAERLAEMWANGVNINWEKYYQPTGSQKISLPTYPFERKRYWPEHFRMPNPFMPGDKNIELVGQSLITLKEVSMTIDDKLHERPELSANFCEAETIIEKILVEIEEELLGIKGIGVNDDFFELGGDSLKAVMLATKIQKKRNIEVTVQEIFERPTIKLLAEYFEHTATRAFEQIQPVKKQDYYEVSAAQRRLYILYTMDKDSTNYHIPNALEIEGNFDTDQMEEVIRKLIRRHEALRTSFELVGGEIYQRIADDVKLTIDYYDVTSDADKEQKSVEILRNFIQPFNLNKAPLFKVGLIRTEANKYLFIVDLHHIISDGTSMGIIVQEFIQMYNGKLLPELKIHYKDYAAWQNNKLKEEEAKKHEVYWLKLFTGEIPKLNLPVDYPRSSVQKRVGAALYEKLNPEIKIGLEKVARQTGATLYMVMLAAFNVLLSKYSGQDDIVIGAPIADRLHADLEHNVGMFVNTLAFRNHPNGSKSFQEFLGEVRLNALQAYEHQDYPFDELVNKLHLQRSKTQNPLFDVMLVHQNRNFEMDSLAQNRIKFYPIENNSAMFDLTMNYYEEDGQLSVALEYCATLFKRENIEKLIKDYTLILKTIIDTPEIQIKEINMGTGLKLLKKAVLDYSFNF